MFRPRPNFGPPSFWPAFILARVHSSVVRIAALPAAEKAFFPGIAMNKVQTFF
jgi:hypothetical protein